MKLRRKLTVVVLALMAINGCGVSLFQTTGKAETGTLGPPAESENVTSVTVDFGSTEYPALVRKIGLNQNWDFEDDDDHNAMNNAAEASAVISSGLVELRRMVLDGKVLAENKDLDVSAPNAVLGPEPIFTRNDQGEVASRIDENLLSLRQGVKNDGMINFLQLAGTPDIFTLDPSLKYKENGTGNWYPFPVIDQIPELSKTLADFAGKLYSTDRVPTIFAFWQEPDHTIGGNLSREEAYRKYLNFYKRVGPAIKALDRDAMVAGIQQNAGNGINPNGTIDGADYKTFADMLLKLEKDDGVRYPLDYITVQNYQGDKSKDIVENSRVAFGSSRFNRSPLFMNEFDFNKGMSFDDKYNKPDQVVQLIDILKYIAEQPDVSNVLLKSAVFNQKALAYYPIQFLGEMPELRRNITVSGSGASVIQGLASSNDDTAAMMLWNEGEKDQSIQLSLENLNPPLVNGAHRLVIQTMDSTAPAVTNELKLTEGHMEVPQLTIPANGFLMVRIGAPEGKSVEQHRITQSDYAKHMVWVPRLEGQTDRPAGMGHYDIRSDSLIASVNDKSGIGLSGVVLKNVPDFGQGHDDYKLYADISSSGLPAENNSTVLGLRVDYLDGDSSMKTVFYRISRYTGSDPWPLLDDWLPEKSVIRQDIKGNGNRAVLDIAEMAPEGWAAADGGSRRVQVSLILKGVDGKASVIAGLSDTK